MVTRGVAMGRKKGNLVTFHDLYYNPKANSSLGGRNRFLEGVAKHKALKRKDALAWLAEQDAYTMHKPARKNFKTSRVMVH